MAMKMLFAVMVIVAISLSSGCRRTGTERVGSANLIDTNLVISCQAFVEKGKQQGIELWMKGDPVDNLPESIRMMAPQCVEILVTDSATVVDIQLSGGFRHNGYLVVCHSKEDSFVPTRGRRWRITKIAEGVFKYVE